MYVGTCWSSLTDILFLLHVQGVVAVTVPTAKPPTGTVRAAVPATSADASTQAAAAGVATLGGDIRPTRGRVSMDILPHGTRSTFMREFVPKLLEYVGTQWNPWDLQEVPLGKLMQSIWEEVFVGCPLGYVIVPGTPMYRLVSSLLTVLNYSHY